MNNVIKQDEMEKPLKRMIIFLFLSIFAGVPSLIIFDRRGYVIFAIFSVIAMYYAIKIESLKVKYNLKTFNDFIVFSDGKNVDTLPIKRSRKKYLVERLIIVSAFTIIFCILSWGVKMLTIYLMNF
ncbi:hypothetical protein [Enterococcus casseliflavus]|uniref:hypothetical protein n=1 Tax=Enterococcus casseliflavus TaxID=37734 RepID=UPI0034D217D0